MDKSKRFHLPWIIWLILIFGLCFTPGDQLPSIEWELISIGTVAHFSLYFGLANLMLLGFLQHKKTKLEKKMNLSNLRVYLYIILAGILIGIFVELVQGNFIYRRYYDPEDILVNGIGTIFGAFAYTLIGRKLV
ncbi:MAG: VanZ family protein [Crocinitomicaceae bacterium]